MKPANAAGAGIQVLVEKIRQGDAGALGRAITGVLRGDEAGRLLEAALPPPARPAQRIGITGAAGAGKSTLVAALARELLGRGERVAVVASDPASPFSGGAFLGDRVRLAGFRLAAEPRLFFRSLAFRGESGGIGPEAAKAARVLEAAGFPWIFLETVGAGQSEIAIRGHAETVVLVLPPGAGDEIQLLKAGILEIAHILVVSRGREPGAECLRGLLIERVEVKKRAPGEWIPPVLLTEALRGEGIVETLEAITKHQEWLKRR
ncbi:MAG: methylmalonyl Co-A mutase-associated GTPase MeaB [Planctomycetes bacterium]|nr:methylmalonyl Co-A mutase-associated GTPase MeaB [Planctomycetota bacterium]